MKWCCIYKRSHNIRRIYDSYKDAYWNEMFQSDVCYGRDTKIVPYTKNVKYKEFLKELDTYDHNYWTSIFLFGIIPLKIYKKTKFKKLLFFLSTINPKIHKIWKQ